MMEGLKVAGVNYISNRAVGVADAVMFDIDDTLIFSNGRPNGPIIDLLYIASLKGYKIVIITARSGSPRVIDFTINQLHEYNIMYDYLGFTSPETKGIMKRKLPYNFILSVGDMHTDLTETQHWLNLTTFLHG